LAGINVLEALNKIADLLFSSEEMKTGEYVADEMAVKGIECYF